VTNYIDITHIKLKQEQRNLTINGKNCENKVHNCRWYYGNILCHRRKKSTLMDVGKFT